MALTRRRVGGLLLVGATLAAPLLATGQGRRGPAAPATNPPYDGRFTFTRIRHDSPAGWRFGGRGGSSWGHDYNNDIAEYWEWSDTGYLPIDYTNEAYKLGVNYIVYALTH